MHCFSADCTFVSTLLQARCIHAICHVGVDPVRRVILDLMLKFFCRISSFHILRKMSNSMYGSLSPRATHCALFLQPSSPVAPQLLLNPSTIKKVCNVAQKLELGGASSVWCWLFLCTQESGKRLIDHWNDGITIIPRASIIQPPQWCFLLICFFALLFLCTFVSLLFCSFVQLLRRGAEYMKCAISWVLSVAPRLDVSNLAQQPTNRPTQSTQHQHQQNTTPKPTQAQQPNNRPANQQPTNKHKHGFSCIG